MSETSPGLPARRRPDRDPPRPPNVPVTMGSPRFRRAEAGSFFFTDAWFPPHTVLPHHAHARPVLGVMLEGGFEDAFSRRTLEVTAGTVFTEPGEEGHSNRIGDAGARVMVLQPDPDDGDLWETARDLLDGIRATRHAGVVASARRLVREMEQPDELSELAMESLALDLLVSAGRHEELGDEPGWLARVDEVVREGFRTALRVGEIADAVGVHRGHLARVYRRHRGLPLGDHIRSLRLGWAAERLVDTEAEISSIAVGAGFSDQSHLTRAFKRHFGVPPGRYRKRFGA